MKPYKDFTLREWLDYLENRHQQEIQLGLSRIQQVAESLSLTNPHAKIITVAGTNGKGSTVAMLEAIYLAAGYQVASYTSPHLLVFNERIRINQQPISDEHLSLAFLAIELGREAIPLTYFEMATLAALWHFKQQQLDLIILEVGLGGRLDATNIIASDLAIITSIDFDHQEFLGETREEIGFEKAGILRENKPFIFADKNPPASIVNRGLALNASMYLVEREYKYRLINGMFELKFQGESFVFPQPKLHSNSAAAAMVASLLLKAELPVDYLHLKEAVEKVFLAGRLQLVQKEGVTTLFDVSHNPQAAEYLAEFIKNFHPKKSVHAVFSALKDKNIAGIVSPLNNVVHHWYPALLTGKRAASRQQLMEALNLDSEKVFICHDDPLTAYQAACRRAHEGDLIVVYGSFMTVGMVMQGVS
ncbi:bifunctional protein FolC [Legionella nautarum]|uniref:Dihydrofolate synthase/folylpolyglutamate synthase n=1 Tax=Legionella nautarum TaxID=45070 RepID=A0A0W0WVN6_9GAMM|nr:bifunctional tetrahydrofolate synthase/dihydrofolate synthase [Legionella nautarum]KTD36373.1 bifunctional protein FolC [Legionella nautarum]